MPTNAAGYFPASNVVRNYVVDIKQDGLRLDAENVIAVRVYNRGGSGGLYNNPLTISCPKAADGLSMSLTDINVGQYHYDIEVINAFATTTTGTLDVTITDRETGAKVKSLTKKLSLKRNKPVRVTVPYSMDKMYQLTATYTDAKTGKVLTESKQLKYVLTPAAPATPRFNGAPVWGVRPGSPVIYRFPVSGEKPIKFTCNNLPAGLQLTERGVLSGKIDKPSILTFTVNAIDQDILGKQADRVSKTGDIEVWSRLLADGAIAVGIFNTGEKDQQVDMKALIPAKEPVKNVRDLWRQKDLSESELSCTIPAHGCRYLKVKF